MFCPSCGTEYGIELNYCNRCGANLNLATSAATGVVQVSVTKPVLILGTIMLFLTLGGFAGVLSSAVELARTSGGGDLSMAIVFFGMLSILTIDILLLRQLSKLISAALSPNRLAAKKPLAQAQNEMYLTRPATARLEPVPSVTENTTRFFERSNSALPELEAQKTADKLTS